MKFSAKTSGGKWYATLTDISNNDVPVRAEYGRKNGNTYNIHNSNGYGTSAVGPRRASKIVWTIACQDYPFGDDCSNQHFG